MTAKCRTFTLGMAAFLTIGTVVADTVTTADEFIACSVESVEADSLDLKLPQDSARILSTRGFHEVCLSDSSRVAALAAQPPQAGLMPESSRSVLLPDVRAREIRLRLDRAREARARGLPWYADVLDTLPRGASPSRMAVCCRDMDNLLRVCGRSDETVAGLLREVSREERTVRRIWPTVGTLSLSGVLGAVLGGPIGALAIVLAYPNGSGWSYLGPAIGFAGGCAAGSGIGAIVGASGRARRIVKHRYRVNELVRRVNLAVVTTP